MPKEVIFKTFKTYRHPYVYDRHTNGLVTLTEDEYQELVQVEKGVVPPEQSTTIKKYQEHGLLMPNVVEVIEHSVTSFIDVYATTRMQQLILQVTQQCNLRCSYCTFSGNYRNQRTHAGKTMSLETAKKAIDFFLDRNDELQDVVIGFYGGEPLLMFDLIKECVAYANNKVEGKTIRYNITTNGTLISDEIADFFVENGFMLNISLDGSKEEHDVNRKFQNGEGSFDVIIQNIRRLQERYPEYNKNVSILTTIEPRQDVGCIMEYFNTDDVFKDRNIMFNTVNEKGYKGDLSFDQKFFIIRNYEYMKMLFSLIGKLDSKYVSPLVVRARGSFDRKQKGLLRREELFPKQHHGGPCLPGIRRLFVRTDGALFPCERVSDMLDYFIIGTLEDGLNIDRMKDIFNIGKLTERECIGCWCLRHCMLCASQIIFDSTKPTNEDKLRECSSCKNLAFSDLYELCVLNEFGLDMEGGLES